MTVVDSVSGSANSLFTAVNAYAASHHDGLVALALFAGVIVAFSGRTILKPTVFLIGFAPTAVIITALGLALIAEEHPGTDRQSLLEAVVVALATLAGILVGVVMLRLLFGIATFMLCAGFGAVMVFVLHLFLMEPATGKNGQIVLYVIAIFASLLVGLFSVSYPETGIILGTAFDGAALSVYSLARFLGHRPNIFAADIPTATDAEPDSPWWAIGYAIATIVLGVFGGMSQRRVALADAIITRQRQIKDNPSEPTYDEEANIPYGSNLDEIDPLLAVAEPPRTPPYMKSSVSSPGSRYGALEQDNNQYSVVRNLGAGPLGQSEEDFPPAKGSNGPL
ncbi:unnamed protein product [Chondrus crispus]|uniref:Transmembrane protein 198 n=1 Tax=Chondrus crispus TaxID=2769 RepID=R7QEI9_CHOCR|nr:unnamed protein product [Chondrus crispus]CDF35871.1 unnamed protein product [Chondrus crispus]|eukprot:XP_005715690.1 unnamed protein product [Chondrus crispus]